MKFLETPIPPEDYRENPYVHIARWREQAVLHFVPARNLWLAVSYDMITQLLRDERLALGKGSSFAERSREFRITAVRQLRGFFAALDEIGIDAVIRDVVNDAFGRVRGAGTADLVGEFAQVVPRAVMGWLLGVPNGELRHLAPLGAGLFDEYGLCPKRGSTVRDKALLDAYFLRHLARARQAQSAPLMRLLIGLQQEHGIADRVLADVCSRTFNAGMHSTSGVLANVLLRLIQDADGALCEQARAGRPDALIEELLRLDTSIFGIWRQALCDFELTDAQVKKGQTVILMAAAANRDPAYFPHPDIVDLERAGRKHLSFGQGAFHCLGEHLARKEIACVVETVLPHLDAIKMLEPPARKAGWLVHEAITLRVTIGGSRHAH